MRARLALLIAAGGSPKLARQTVARHGGGVRAVQSEHLAARIRSGLSSAISNVDRELETAARCGARWVLAPVWSDAVLICVRGRIPAETAVALVGSRDADSYGLSIADALARALAASEIAVVSGAARGVDEAAHRGAMQAGGRTLAILGEGIGRGRSAPRQALLDAIAERGAVVSELLTAAHGAKHTFPDRNRLIAAAGVATVVVQARTRSGSLITARVAREQGRRVFAVPGDVTTPLSAGTNLLIQRGAASMLIHPRDLVDVVGRPELTSAAWPSAPRGGAPRVDGGLARPAGPGAAVLRILAERGPMSSDELAQRVPNEAASLSTTLLDLELKGQLVRERGDRYRVATDR